MDAMMEQCRTPSEFPLPDVPRVGTEHTVAHAYALAPICYDYDARSFLILIHLLVARPVAWSSQFIPFNNGHCSASVVFAFVSEHQST